MSVLWDVLRLSAAAYLLLLALAAVGGWHTTLLLYPARTAYSFVRLVIGVVSFGRVNMVPVARRVRRTQKRRLRNLRFEASELRERLRPRASAPGDAADSQWVSGDQR